MKKSTKTIGNLFSTSLLLLAKGGVIGVFFLAFTAFGQQTLEFNQVKLVTAQETVPTGHVWKITAVLPSNYLTTVSTGTSSASTAITYTTFLVNGNSVVYSSSHSRGRGYPTSTSSHWGAYAATTGVTGIMSVWLPGGTTLAAGTNVYALSVIEFKVNP